MGTKHETIEGRITTYFQTAEAVESLVMFRVIKSILASRGFEIDGRKTVKKKAAKPVAAPVKPAERAKDDVRAPFTMDSKAS